jgi:hypothetical protein
VSRAMPLWKCSRCGCSFPDHPVPHLLHEMELCSSCVTVEVLAETLHEVRAELAAVKRSLRAQKAVATRARNRLQEALDRGLE